MILVSNRSISKIDIKNNIQNGWNHINLDKILLAGSNHGILKVEIKNCIKWLKPSKFTQTHDSLVKLGKIWYMYQMKANKGWKSKNDLQYTTILTWSMWLK